MIELAQARAPVVSHGPEPASTRLQGRKPAHGSDHHRQRHTAPRAGKLRDPASEIVSWGHTTLTATGLGGYVAQVTRTGDWPHITLGVGMMSLYVVGLNRLL